VPVDTSAPSSDTPDAAPSAPRRTGHGNRAGARKHAAVNPAIDALGRPNQAKRGPRHRV